MKNESTDDASIIVTKVNQLAKLRDAGDVKACLAGCLTLLQKDKQYSRKVRFLIRGLVGDCYLDLKRYKDAVRSYDELVTEDPCSVAFANRAYAKWRLGQLIEASKDFRRAIQLNPKDSTTIRNAAELASELGQLRRAVILANRACHLAPNHKNSFLVAAIVRNRQGKREEARKLLEKVLELDPGNQQALRGMSEIDCTK